MSASAPAPVKVEVEVWRARLKAARERYHLAAEESKKVLLARGSGDSFESLHNADAARREYMRVLGIFSDLVIHRRIPEEGQ